MHLLQITHQYPPHHIGGVELITRSLAHDLAAQGHHVTVLTRSPAAGVPSPAPSDPPAAVDVIRWPQRGPTRRFLDTFGDRRAARALEALLNAQSFDVAHLQHLIGLPADLAAVLARRGVPYVVTLHDYWYACANAQLVTNFDGTLCAGPQPSLCGRCAAARAGIGGAIGALFGAALAPALSKRNELLRQVLQHAALVSAPSRYVVDWFSAHEYDTTHWQVIPYGIDTDERTTHSEAGTRNRMQLAYLGGIAPQKGVHTVIEAFNHMPAQALLIIAGPQDTHPEYVARLRAAARHPGIRFVGPLDRAGVWHLLSASHALIAPSVWPETFMLVLHEALAAGCHVIASDIGAQGEAARAAGSFTFPPGDAAALAARMREALDAPERGAINRPRTRRDYAKQFEYAYAELVRNRAPAEPRP